MYSGVCRGCERLNLHGNALASLPPGVFSDLSSLQRLSLYDNALASLSPDVFSGLSSLEWLALGGNAVERLPLGLFAGLSSLETLELWDNALESLPPGVFSDLGSLERLDLAANALTSLSAGVFSGLRSLRHLDLRHNALESLPADVFSELPFLQRLQLSGNPGYPLFETTTTTMAEPRTAVPIASGLDPSFPNPFNSTTRIPYRLAASGPVRLTIHAVSGQPVRTLVNGVQASGRYQVSWDGRDREGVPVAVGVYLARLNHPGGRQVRPLLLVK